MNNLQRGILGLGVIAVALLVMNPPWYYEYKYEPARGMINQEKLQITRTAGHHPLWDGIPSDQSYLIQIFGIEPDKSDLRYFTMRINKDIFTIEIAGVLIVCALLVVIARKQST